MKHAAWWIPLVAVVFCAAGAVRAEEVVVEIDGLKSRTPAAWVEEKPMNFLRLKQFRLPKVQGDTMDAELVIFSIKDTVEEGVKRWKGDFQPPAGKTIDDVAKVSEIKLGDVTAVYVDIAGTYLFKMRPRDPNEKPQPRPDQRMLGVHYSGKSPYQIRLVGPAKTVGHYKAGFDEWIKNFK